ncbi:isocitrate lyase/phosphoenolpyruvate mutase family protein [Dietzia sp. PP-33]|jgi:2-methylisocitrate lyase-like PEP mutase family enzyme|uniref:isocitrate lyase/PEP mutase family protein n=1 Tax=Dietzia sp. PP-33 TaxID=2957500 RepID=UPI0029B3869A|nr:isocitrate lyase/phosphoenolpyruvate mutase family protein [Dietzia sp. PP-33]MDX2355825.1 isocitrate lyase/phosphoenolpyruvate mutase family protein [Dietzia sp. PP-33]
MTDVGARARELAALHESGDLVVLPTVWDTWSARVAAGAGFHGLTVGSHPVADAIGSADGENMDFGEYLGVVRRIADSVDVPVSADVESGYGFAPEELISRLLEVGAVGANIEDVVHGEGGRVRDKQEHADYIAGARRAADEAGVPFVINGRTDAVKLGSDVFSDPLAEAAERIVLMEQAGARSVYPVGLTTADQVTTLVKAVSIPVNVTAHPVKGHGAGDLDDLTRLGARRVTFGPLWQMWLAEVSADRLADWLSVDG